MRRTTVLWEVFAARFEDAFRRVRKRRLTAGELARGLAAVPGAVLAREAEANEIFVRRPEAAISSLEADGFKFYRWPGPDPRLVRLVTAFDTDPAHVAAFVDRAAVHAGAARPRAARRRMP